MVRSAIMRIVPAGQHYASIAVLTWMILTLPFALIAGLTDILNWKSVVFAPGGGMQERLHELLARIPALAGVPIWVFSVLYVVLLIGGVAWYYWSSVETIARRVDELSKSGALSGVKPISTEMDNLEGAVSFGAILLGGIGSSAINGGIATTGAAFGPPGLAMAACIISILTIFALSRHSEKKKEEARAHAEAESERLEQERRAIVDANVANFKAKERRKLSVAVVVALAIVALNFLGPIVYGAFA